MREKNTEIKTKFQEDEQLLVKKRECVSSVHLPARLMAPSVRPSFPINYVASPPPSSYKTRCLSYFLCIFINSSLLPGSWGFSKTLALVAPLPGWLPWFGLKPWQASSAHWALVPPSPPQVPSTPTGLQCPRLPIPKTAQHPPRDPVT